MEQENRSKKQDVDIKESVIKPKMSPLFHKYRKWIIVFLVLVVVGIVTYFNTIKRQEEKTPVSTSKVPPSTTSKQSQESGNNFASDLLNDLKNLRSDILVSDWKTQYAVYTRRKYAPFFYYPHGQDKGYIQIWEDLIVLNLETGEKEIYGVHERLIPQEVLTFLENTPAEVSFRLYLDLLRWSPFSENVFWGKLSIYSQGDPPVANELSFFKVDLKNSTIDKFPIPSPGLFGVVNENTNAEKVLYESVGDGLSLYQYDLKSKENRLIVSYNKEVFDTYCGSFIEYVNTLYGDCGRERGLLAEWEEKGISYFDFVTRKKVVVQTD